MAKMTRTWWGESFLDVLSVSMDTGRLGRGRAYAGPNRLLEFDVKGKVVTAKIRGNKNPYFGVYKEPRYKVTVELKQFSPSEWEKLIESICDNAAFLSQLMLNEMPTNIESVFTQSNLHLLPHKRDDLISDCSCPDYASPCKHVAGVYYKVASLLDRDPFLLFQLRGMDIDQLQKKLAASPLGQALIDQWGDNEQPIEYVARRYTDVTSKVQADMDLKNFWQGDLSLPLIEHVSSQTASTAVLIKKGGDYPAFWHKDASFIETMELLYARIISKNKTVL